MESSHNILRSSSQIPQKDQFDTFLQTKKFPFIISSRRTPSFSSLSSSSSSSSSSSYNPSSDLDSPLSPATTHGTTFSGVPFSWEHFPGIPKKVSKKNPQESSSIKLLPLPPTNKRDRFSLDDMIKIKKTTSMTPSISNPNKQQQQTYDSESDVDPFLAALIECSKEDDNENVGGSAKVSRSLSDRFGFINLYASCKRTCAVAESIRHLPKSTTGRSSSYDLIKYPSR